MPTIDALTIGAHVSFDLYPAAVIGTTFNNVEVTDILSFSTAMALGVDVAAMHANIFPTLPNGTPADPTKYQYVRVVLPNGNIQILGLPWIKANTIVINSTKNLTLTIVSVNPVDQTRVLELLAHGGFTVVNPVLS
jgi:hypothetical protein